MNSQGHIHLTSEKYSQKHVLQIKIILTIICYNKTSIFKKCGLHSDFQITWEYRFSFLHKFHKCVLSFVCSIQFILKFSYVHVLTIHEKATNKRMFFYCPCWKSCVTLSGGIYKIISDHESKSQSQPSLNWWTNSDYFSKQGGGEDYFLREAVK